MKKYPRSVTITIHNSSDTTVLLMLGRLTTAAGQWDSSPALGIPLNHGVEVRYVNFGSNAFASLGGLIELVPVNDGYIRLEWAWPAGDSASGNAIASDTALSVTSELIESGGANATVRFVVSNA